MHNRSVITENEEENLMPDYVDDEPLVDYYRRKAIDCPNIGDFFYTIRDENSHVSYALNSAGKKFKCNNHPAGKYMKVTRVAT